MKQEPTPRLTKAEMRERRQQERLEAEKRRRAKERYRLLALASIVGLVVIIGGILAVLHVRQNATTQGAAATETASSENRPLPVPGTLPGIQVTKAPWPPEYGSLVQRYLALHFPPNGDESYHIHALLHVYVEGQPVTVPANMGISAAARLESPLHTHDTTGVIHVEAAHEFPFRLADIFSIWGVAFTNQQLGGYTDTDQEHVQVYANGNPVSDPSAYVIKPHDNIVVAYGVPGSFPTEPPADVLKGL